MRYVDACDDHHDFMLSPYTDWDLAERVADDCDGCTVVID